MASAFSRVAVLEREHCFLICYAPSAMPTLLFNFNASFDVQFHAELQKRLQRRAEDGRNMEERSRLERRRRNWRLFTPASP